MLHFFFYKLKARPSISKKIVTHFIAMLALWREENGDGSGTEPVISLRFALNLVKELFFCS